MQNIDIISKVLEILPTINQKYPHINFGGCGTFSYYFHEMIHMPELWNNVYDHSNSPNMVKDISKLIDGRIAFQLHRLPLYL